MEEPRISTTESLQNEKQILVDPLSLKDSPIKPGYLETTTMLPTITTTSSSIILHPPPLQPPKPRFLSTSLPNSANSSPRFASALSKKKPKGESPESQCQASNLTHKLQHVLQEVHLRKSKSCGEAREFAPSDDFDHWLTKLGALEHDKWHHDNFSKIEAVKESPKSVKLKHMKTTHDGFKCSALCLYLPGFGGKVKPVKARKEESEKGGAMSRTVSLENFECGSWASAAMLNEIEGDSTNSYFDLPMELIKCSASEVYSPVAGSFVWERDLKGILKNGSSRASVRKSDASPRHVRFSTSSSASHPASPVSCISPRLRKAREDFNAFLAAAQSA
ncbi:histone H3 centromeric protein HTR12 [Spatholobus suberectus]|nr:histone H3 centromeric protein HTR12 [Spatholobus suberectus]